MENQEKHIPAGYREDARGALIPEGSIKPIDKERDELVQAIVRLPPFANRSHRCLHM